jgi:hydrogenase maturation factor
MSCGPHDGCITCGDTAVSLRVVSVDHDAALADCQDGQGRRECVDVGLVWPVAIGDRVLVHAGAALTRVAETEP